jgi:hypothetical protein
MPAPASRATLSRATLEIAPGLVDGSAPIIPAYQERCLKDEPGSLARSRD